MEFGFYDDNAGVDHNQTSWTVNFGRHNQLWETQPDCTVDWNSGWRKLIGGRCGAAGIADFPHLGYMPRVGGSCDTSSRLPKGKKAEDTTRTTGMK